MREMKDSGVEWIGEIPSEWDISKVGYFFEVQLGKMLQPSQENHEDTLENYLCAANVGKNVFKPSPLKQMWFNPNEYSVFDVRNGDLLVVEGGDVASCAIVNIDNPRVFIQNALHRVRSKDNSDIRILKYWLWNAKGIGYIDLICNKATIAHISKEKFISLPYAVIPKLEQSKIADFLDRKCAEIDAVIEKTKATIEEYKKLKQSVITEAVTKGICGDRPMKDSGIEWIGEIPAEWDVVKIKTLFDYRNERNDKPLEEVNLISLYTDLGVVQHCDLEATTGNKASNADGYKLVYEDDIVVNIILCWMGAIGRSAYTGVTSPAYDVYSPKEGTNTKFYHHLFRTQGFNGDCYKVGRGIMAMRWRTYSDQFRAIKVVAPPQEEQQDIVDYLDKKCAEIDTLIAKKTALLGKMESYKKSVIYEYVTGKKEV